MCDPLYFSIIGHPGSHTWKNSSDYTVIKYALGRDRQMEAIPMKQPIAGAIIGSLLILVASCAGQKDTMHQDGSELDVILETLDNRILQLNTNIERLGKQMIALKQLPDTPDPALRELRELDLAGWQLHQKQWMLQREHFLFTREQLQRVRETPEKKPQLLAQWTTQQQQYQAALAGLRQQRHSLEEKYFQVEAQVVEQYLR